MTKPELLLNWFLRHDIWIIPVTSLLVTGIAVWFLDSGDKFWLSLEALLLSYTVLYLFIAYYAHFKYFNDILSKRQNMWATIFLATSFICFVALTIWVVLSACIDSWDYPPPILHIILPIVSIGLSSFAACVILRGGFDGNKLNTMKNNGKRDEVLAAYRYRRGYKLGLWHSDMPTLFSLVILLIVVVLVRSRFPDLEYMHSFVAGIVMFHLMASNFVYAATSGE